jgi:hypothetical protein
MEEELGVLGFSEKQLQGMTPGEATDLIKNQVTAQEWLQRRAKVILLKKEEIAKRQSSEQQQ